MSATGHAVRIARISFTRSLRKHTDDASNVVGLLVLGLLVAGATLGGGVLARLAGRQLATGGGLADLPVVAGARGVVAMLWLVFVGVFAVRAFGQRGSVDATGGLLVVVPTVEVVAGVVLSEMAFVAIWTIVPALAVGVGLWLGSGAAVPLVTVPVAVLAVGTTAAAVGYPVGLALRHVVSRVPFVARHKNALVVLAFLAYFGLLVTGTVDRLAAALFEPMQRTPMGWYADLALAGVPGVVPSTLRAAAALALPGVVVPLGIGAASRVAGRHWFSDPVLAGEEERVRKPERTWESARTSESTRTRESERTRGSDRARESREFGGRAGVASPFARFHRSLERFAGRSTAALVVLAYQRAYRAPLKLLYAAYPLFVLVGFAPSIVEEGQLPAVAPVAALLFVAWGAGSVFVLNPLGDQGAGLPAALLSSVTGRAFVRAHVLASLLVAVPLGVVATLAVALASPLDAAATAAAVGAAPVVALLGSAAAVGIGVAFPRFEAVSVTRSTTAVIPSKTAFVLFSGYLLVTTVTGAVVVESAVRPAVATLVAWVLPFGLTTSPTGVLAAATAALLALAATPVASYRYAVRRFDGYTLD